MRWARLVRAAQTRIVIVVQLLLGALVLIGSLLVIVTGLFERPGLLVAGGTVMFLATAASLVLPWDRLPHAATAVVAAVDIAAIGLLRFGAPDSGLAVLWAFPVIWLAWSFGLAGTISGVVAVTTVYAAVYAFGPDRQQPSLAVVLLPLSLAGLAAVSYSLSRRADAQRDLLELQSRALRLTAERARRQEEFVTGVLDAVDFGVIRLAPDGAIDLANQANTRLQRVRERTRDSTYAADGLTPIGAWERPLARAQRGETLERELVWYGDPGEDRRAVSTTARRIHDARGEDAGAIVVSQDVTAEQLALRAREDLMASVSHELRTPLTSILGYLELALDDATLAPPTRRGLEVAQRGAERLMELIADILATAASSRHSIALTVEPDQVDISDVIHAALEAAQPRAVERDMTLDGSGIERAEAWADPHRIRQVVDNLLSNAIKYADTGGLVQVGCTTDGHNTWIAVRDDGPGVSADELPRLFDPYFRSDAVRNTSTHGSGLGLAISRDIARAHAGEITVQSTPGEGATFVVRLPSRDPRGESR